MVDNLHGNVAPLEGGYLNEVVLGVTSNSN